MVSKKETIKEIKKECSIELNTKKLNSMNIDQLQELLSDFKKLKGEGWKEVLNRGK